MSVNPGRDLAATIYDLLVTDPCLMPLLDTRDELEGHGTDAWCDEPESSHVGRPVRREQQRWPSDFTRAVVTFGRYSRAPHRGLGSQPWIEGWEFVVSIFVQEKVERDDGTNGGPADLWAHDILDAVIRILGWSTPGIGGTPPVIGCDGAFLVAKREMITTVDDLHFDTDHRYWTAAARFRWLLIGRGPVAPLCHPCGSGT